jgi:hypothetical protein
MTKTKAIYYGVLVSLMGILIGSVSHLSYTFYTLEEKDSLGFVSFTISLGIEAGMLAIAFGIAERRRAGRRIIDLLFYQVFFAAVNFYGNLYFAISVFKNKRNLTMMDITDVDPLILFTACFLSGSLPILALSLSELQSIFGLRVKQEEKQDTRKIEKEKKNLLKEEKRELKRKQQEELLKNYTGRDRVILEKEILKNEEASEESEEELKKNSSDREREETKENSNSQVAETSKDFQSEALKEFPVDVFEGNNRRRIPIKDN